MKTIAFEFGVLKLMLRRHASKSVEDEFFSLACAVAAPDGPYSIDWLEGLDANGPVDDVEHLLPHMEVAAAIMEEEDQAEVLSGRCVFVCLESSMILNFNDYDFALQSC